MEKKYIDAEEFKRRLRDEAYEPAVFELCRMVDEMDAADVAPVAHGEWIDRDEKTWCSVCHASNKQYKPPYCPHCGAIMNRGGE